MEDFASAGLLVRHTNLKSKCWVVRPGSRYRFINEFLDLGCVAMAHLDDAYLDNSEIEKLRSAEGEVVYSFCNELPTKLTINTRGQVLAFIREMDIGDVVFTLSGANVYPGVITGHPYVASDNFSGAERFCIRRTVSWGDPIDRGHIPVTLTKSFHAYQAVFSLGEKSKEIHHWLNAFFVSNETYYSSLRVNQPGDLSHHSLKNLSEIMDRLQVLSLMIGDNEIDGSTHVDLKLLIEQMRVLGDEGRLVLTSQQAVMSPGDLWYGFRTGSRRAGVAFLLGAAMLFNQQIVFADSELETIRKEIAPIMQEHIATLQKDVDLPAVQRSLLVKPASQNRSFVDQAADKTSETKQLPKDGAPRYSTR
jgi:hypothetical protein